MPCTASGESAYPVDLPVAGSPEQGYRLRAKLHVVGGRAGFFREGSHTLCDATATGQLRPESVPAVDRLLSGIGGRANRVATVVVAENVPARQRVLHLEGADGEQFEGLEIGAMDRPRRQRRHGPRPWPGRWAGRRCDMSPIRRSTFSVTTPPCRRTRCGRARRRRSFRRTASSSVRSLAPWSTGLRDSTSPTSTRALGCSRWRSPLGATTSLPSKATGRAVGTWPPTRSPSVDRLRPIRTSGGGCAAADRQGAFRRGRAGPAAYRRVAGRARRRHQSPHASPGLRVVRPGDARPRQRAAHGQRLQSVVALRVRPVSQHRASSRPWRCERNNDDWLLAIGYCIGYWAIGYLEWPTRPPPITQWPITNAIANHR